MRRRIVFSLAAVFLVLGLVAFGYRHLATHGNAGYVIIGLDRWVLETSLYVMVVALVLAFLLFYLMVRALLHAWRLPKAIKRRDLERRSRRSQEALVAGLLETAEGNWEKAERNLIRHVADSGTPLINYLTAARAAHSRGAHAQRDQYLELARQSTPKAELAVELTRAELQLSTRQFQEALESLTRLQRIAPGHAAVLRLLHRVYAQMEDWEALQRLLPALHKHKVLMEAELKLLETETYSALLKQKAQTRDVTALRELWSRIPPHIRELTKVAALYFAAMIEAGAGAEIEEALRLALGKDWNETLLVLYGCIELADTERQLHHAENWLAVHAQDAVLLRVLAKLALRIGHTAKAQDYLQRSLAAEPSVEAYQLLGDLLFARKDFAAASEFYRKGLMLASSEVVHQIERHPEDQPAPAPVTGALAASV